MAKKMRMYVWDKVLQDCSYGKAIAVAQSVEEARSVILRDAESYLVGTLAQDIACEPDHIFDLPHGVNIPGSS